MKDTHYPETLPILPLAQPPDVTVPIPGSKSLTNRALILAALAEGKSTLLGALTSEDTLVMSDSLHRLGFTVDADAEAETITVLGQGGRIPAADAKLFLANSGTSIRFLTAFTALGTGRYRLDGVERMRQRPQQDLLDALNGLGVSARSELSNGCPPLIVEPEHGLPGGTTRLNAEASSQFLTALLMVAPYARQDVTIEIEGQLRPFYIEITRQMMAQWGVQITRQAESRVPEPSLPLALNQPYVLRPPCYHIASGQRYAAQAEYRIEPDASSASYFFAAAALTGGRVTIPGLGSDALQGDVRFATEVLAEMGCTVTHDNEGLTVVGPPDGKLQGVDRDMSAISDTSLTLAALAPFAASPTTVRNIGHARQQECDRIAAVCTELTRLGVEVEERSDGFTICPARTIQPATLQTYGDHRVAMSFALIGLKVPGIVIDDPACVAKTFPDYWQRLERLRKEQ
ncbi:MAG TPA: 3-phosphoshikimate 1-carboxyvinyltransferase [Chthonomonadaceae bacterium]|nr:3-phosphoshikimate 1-carboxyvinyltransferase [Chthonomonadaceae bacterium]